ncbi:hypothetical protein LOTGIDRAFT_202237 [Lottia gigantea]|uniref:Biogenesis of lysosome-related organelles complex 1 subunit 5 n=1 Tax=Lottia gigantea TaxID=225164 RepID=V4AR85_LOTGI|nr:hypothetical protein LOTGIDRAFT_202237 [Lottia gigantea]ESO96211.1 hypothetical protein LOTGIDRAFT_202237 [Lottia gigantea]
MTADHIFQDVSNLYSRVFDHRPVLQGNINYFVKEFEEKRGDREHTRLHQIDQTTNRLNNQTIPEICNVLQDNFANLNIQISTATELINKIAEKDGKVEKPLLVYQQQRRKEIWDEFMATQKNKSDSADKDYERQVKLLQEHYTNLESALSSSVAPVL